METPLSTFPPTLTSHLPIIIKGAGRSDSYWVARFLNLHLRFRKFSLQLGTFLGTSHHISSHLTAMFAIHYIRFVALLGAISTFVVATPVPHRQSQPVDRGILAMLCGVPIMNALCKKDTGEVNIQTPVGTARGLQTSASTSRFVVKYASAARWELPTKATSWVIPGNNINQMPPVCPQDGVDASAYSEDCLYVAIYTAQSVNPSTPVLVWVHGGSFIVGSASGSGLDGAALARATNSIVVVVQYRLGVLGLLPPSSMSGSSNLAVRDVITALQFIRQVLPSFGGNINQITVAGQSSGGNLIRALLASPSAWGLFNNAAIHSDPMDYGFYKPETVAGLQNYLYTNTSGPLAACTTLQCQKTVSVSDILSAQSNLWSGAPSVYPVTAGGSILRPYHDGQLLQYTLTGNSFPPAANLKPVLVLTVKDEAGPTIGNFYPNAIPAYYVDPTIAGFYDTDRSNKLIASENYDANVYTAQAGVAAGDEARAALTQLFTDNLWRCPGWTFSRTWASKGGKVFTGEFQIGATYPSNSDYSYCTSGGRVCHEDDIYILFGTTPSPTSAQTALTQEIQARYSSFIRTGVPNPSTGSYAAWAQSGSSDVAALKLGGTGNRAAEACDPSFWGASVLYDYQIFGL